MASKISDRLRFQAVREYTRVGRNTASGDMLGNYRGSTTADMLKYLVADQEKIRRVEIMVVTGDTGNDKVISVHRTQTIDQAVSGSSVTTIDLITIASVDGVAGRITYKDLSPVSGDFAPGEELIFKTVSGVQASERYQCFVIVEPTTESPGAIAYPQRMNQSS